MNQKPDIGIKKIEFLARSKKQKKSPEVILESVPNPIFEDEFLNFVKEVLDWKKENPSHKRSNNRNFYDKSKM